MKNSVHPYATQQHTLEFVNEKGDREPYDACSSSPIEQAKAFYGSKFEYVGSSHVLYVNGTRNEFKELYHFFRTV